MRPWGLEMVVLSLRCPAVEGACVGPDSSGGGRPGVGFGRGGGRL